MISQHAGLILPGPRFDSTKFWLTQYFSRGPNPPLSLVAPQKLPLGLMLDQNLGQKTGFRWLLIVALHTVTAASNKCIESHNDKNVQQQLQQVSGTSHSEIFFPLPESFRKRADGAKSRRLFKCSAIFDQINHSQSFFYRPLNFCHSRKKKFCRVFVFLRLKIFLIVSRF